MHTTLTIPNLYVVCCKYHYILDSNINQISHWCKVEETGKEHMRTFWDDGHVVVYICQNENIHFKWVHFIAFKLHFKKADLKISS